MELLNIYYEPTKIGKVVIGEYNNSVVYRAVASIPYGEVSTYSEIANKIGGKGYARVVGNAMSANPVPIIIPCHRIIGKNGGLRGFGGGLRLKRYLLELESENIIR